MAYTFNFIDLFAGAGGLSEGFIRAGFTPIAHIEMNKYACDTLRSRMAYHYLKQHNRLEEYIKYLTYIIHSGFISGYQNRYGDNLKPPTNVYHRMTA